MPQPQKKSLAPAHRCQVKKLGSLRWAISTLPNRGCHLKEAERWILALLIYPPLKFALVLLILCTPLTCDGQLLQNRFPRRESPPPWWLWWSRLGPGLEFWSHLSPGLLFQFRASVSDSV